MLKGQTMTEMDEMVIRIRDVTSASCYDPTSQVRRNWTMANVF